MWSLFLKFSFLADFWPFLAKIFAILAPESKILGLNWPEFSQKWKFQKKAPHFPRYHLNQGTCQFWDQSDHPVSQKTTPLKIGYMMRRIKSKFLTLIWFFRGGIYTDILFWQLFEIVTELASFLGLERCSPSVLKIFGLCSPSFS